VWIAIHQDVTLRKQAETALKELTETLECRVTDRTAELQSALRDMETFSYSIAHDLRTPVRAILSISSLLEEDFAPAFDAAGHDYVRRVQQAAARMGGMIDGLLGLARLLRSEFRAERIDMSVMVRAVAEGLEAGSGGRRVALDIQPQVEVFADRTLASVLIENLIGNAWKFTEKRPDARIEFGLVEKDGVSACFVRDNGAGFDMGHAENLFRPFHRLHAATDFPGNGIGLATAQRIVQRHGGKIWAESSLGAGATFYFTLPEQRSTA
jgi:light-regulated signal transduction histidine kinase (bacteriophytochrome)